MIVVTGSLAFDFIMNFPGRFADHIMPEKIHILNLSFLTKKLNKNSGGTAANIAYTLSLLKQETVIIGTVGKDFTSYGKFLEKSGVVTKYIKTYKNDFTANYFCVVDEADNQIGALYSGAMDKTDKLSLNDIKEKIDFVVISPTKPEAMVKFAKESRQMKIPYLIDLGRQLPCFSKKDLMEAIFGAKVLVANDYEISLLQKKLNMTKREITAKVGIMVTTLADKGSVIETKNRQMEIKSAKPQAIVDPVGAGDAFCAGFVAGLMKNFDLKTCGQMGSVAAVYTVEKYGTTTHRFTIKDFCDRFKKNFKEPLDL